MSDEERGLFEPFVTVGPRQRAPAPGPLACAGRDLPELFGKWSSVSRQFRRWTLVGLWEALNDIKDVGETVQSGSMMMRVDFEE